jgi:hypothetical protein
MWPSARSTSTSRSPGPYGASPSREKLAWLPEGQQPAREQPRALRAGDFQQPPFDALYRPERLEWFPRGQAPRVLVELRRIGDFQQPAFEALYKPERLEWLEPPLFPARSLPRGALDWSQYQVLVIAGAAYDPSRLEWLPGGRAPQVPLELRRLGDFQQPAFESLYRPERLEWLQPPRFPARSLARGAMDWSQYQVLVLAPVYDPSRLEWLPGGRAPQVPLELRRIGDFQAPPFAALYQAAGLQWQPRGTAPRVPVELRRVGDFQQPPFRALYRPELLEWLLGGQQPARALRFVRLGDVSQPLEDDLFGIVVPVFGWGARGRVGGAAASTRSSAWARRARATRGSGSARRAPTIRSSASAARAPTPTPARSAARARRAPPERLGATRHELPRDHHRRRHARLHRQRARLPGERRLDAQVPPDAALCFAGAGGDHDHRHDQRERARLQRAGGALRHRGLRGGRVHLGALGREVGARQTLDESGPLLVKPDPALTAQGLDSRTHARKMLASIETALEAFAANPVMKSYAIGARQYMRADIPDLLVLRDRYRNEAANEDAVARIAAGAPNPRNIGVRFNRV